jgi:hypothetical protein
VKFGGRNIMFRKHYRFKKLVLGLAFASVAVPVAPAGAASLSTFVDGRAAPVSHVSTIQATSEHSALAPTVVPQAHQYAAISERSYGVPGPDPSLVPQLAVSTSTGFDWQDAGIGASTAFGVALLLIVGVAIVRRRDTTGLTSA